jgi:hypothetical protein
MKVLYVGDIGAGGTCLQRLQALQDLGHDVMPVNTAPHGRPRVARALLSRLGWRLFRAGLRTPGPLDLAGVNARILAACRTEAPDVLWIDKGLMIEAETLSAAKTLRPSCRILGYSPDDMGGRHNQSHQFLAHLTLYDCFFTTKSYGVPELLALGCPRVEFVGNAFDPSLHRPIEIGEDDRSRWGGSVGFAGTWERARNDSLLRLARAGYPVTVWGNGWREHAQRGRNLSVRGPTQFGENYARIICATDINLCFLRKLNRDRQATRSIEIPACGAFTLAERTDEHLALFEEGKEAEFFAPDEELVEKADYYLANPALRRKIAVAGRDRCLRSGYSNQSRLRCMLERAYPPVPCRQRPDARPGPAQRG